MVISLQTPFSASKCSLLFYSNLVGGIYIKSSSLSVSSSNFCILKRNLHNELKPITGVHLTRSLLWTHDLGLFTLKNADLQLKKGRNLQLCLRTRACNDRSEVSTEINMPRKKDSRFSFVLEVPRSVWNQVLLQLGNFGFGKRSLWEAGVGLFLLTGIVLMGLTLMWVKGIQLRSRSRKYRATFEFEKAWGINVGTPVRIRGVDIGSVVSVKPSLERLDVTVQIVDTNLVIPRNALVEVNQSGLVSETLIDITPRHPLPKPTVGPLDPGCTSEGLIVCDRQRIKGEQGVSLDELVSVCTKLAKQIDNEGVGRLYDIADRVSLAIEDAKPLLTKMESMATDIQPLINELREGGLLAELEKLARLSTEAGQDLRRINSSILTAENTELLRQSVATLTKTLKHLESISEDVSTLTGDAGTRYNLKQLIQSLSRLVTD